jgi:hypothetical protein
VVRNLFRPLCGAYEVLIGMVEGEKEKEHVEDLSIYGRISK